MKKNTPSKHTKTTITFSSTPLSTETVDAITVCYLANFWNRYCHELTKKEKKSFDEIYEFFGGGKEHNYSEPGTNLTIPTKAITNLVLENLNSFLVSFKEDLKKFENNLKIENKRKKETTFISTANDFTEYLLLSSHIENLIKIIKEKNKSQDKKLYHDDKTGIKLK